jgi:excisionase family DNA binding protein
MAIKDSYYTVTEAAKKLGVSRQTISRWLASGKIVAESVGREKLIRKSQLKNIHVRFREDTFAKNIIDHLLKTIRSSIKVLNLRYKDE